ncbi:MAG: two pore domain potassium channel family protein [Proteobacteria bacterium]|nr:two pore domain potassium channel family protein [Pseudomonadota bacterium]
MFNHSFHFIIGLSGVAADENLLAQRWARRFELPMILLAIWILIEWYLREKGIYSALFDRVTDWAVWLFFMFETVLLTSLVENKIRYLRSNWMNLLIISMGVPLLWGGGTYAAILRSLRLLLIFPLLLNLTATVRKVLARNYLGSVLLVALAFTLLSGLLIAGIDPSIENVWQGIWWAWVTVATVGYGDTVPQSAAGKVFGAVVILFGVGFFSLLTASFSAYFVSRGEIEIEEEELEEISELKDIERRIEAMENTLQRIEDRLNEDRSEKR